MDWERDGITRRAALTRGFGGVALVCSFDFDKITRSGGKKTSAFTRQSASGPFEPFQRDLPIPPLARPVGTSAEGAQQYAFTMKAGKAEILPNLETPVLGYNGLFPGPTIRADGSPSARISPAMSPASVHRS